MIVAVALLIALVCPLIDLFDTWDHAVQTGNETEYNLLVLALCVGLGVSVAQFVLKFLLANFETDLAVSLSAHTAIRWDGNSRLAFVIPIPLSPPVLALRI